MRLADDLFLVHFLPLAKSYNCAFRDLDNSFQVSCNSICCLSESHMNINLLVPVPKCLLYVKMLTCNNLKFVKRITKTKLDF